jgi:hypothetical protein
MNQTRRFSHPDFNVAQLRSMMTSRCQRDATGWDRLAMCASEKWNVICSDTSPGEERCADRASIAVVVAFPDDSEGYFFAQEASRGVG